MNRKNLVRVVALILVAVMVLGFIAMGVSASETFSDSEKVSVGIIGGADGPTAIFVSGNIGGLIAAAVVVIIVIIAVVVVIVKKYRN